MKVSLKGKVVKRYMGVRGPAIILEHYSGEDDVRRLTKDICASRNPIRDDYVSTFKLAQVVLVEHPEDAYKVLWGDEIEFWFASRCELK